MAHSSDIMACPSDFSFTYGERGQKRVLEFFATWVQTSNATRALNFSFGVEKSSAFLGRSLNSS
jgi:hypothetical protein